MLGVVLRYVLKLFPVLFLASAASASNESDILKASNSLRQIATDSFSEGSESQHKAAIALWTTYLHKHGDLTNLNVSKLSDEELQASAEIFTGMSSVGTQVARSSEIYPAVRKTAAAALAVYFEIASRRDPSHEEAAMTYSAVFGLREWELESRMRSSLGPFQNLPYIIDDPGLGTKSSLWYIDPDFVTMKRVAFELTDEVKWIVIASADCAIAKEAIADITKDKALRGMFLDRSLWLTAPGPDSASFPAVLVWNARHPQFTINFIHHWDEWPMLDIRPDSPTFVRIEDNHVVGVHSGWGTGKHLPGVRNVLRELEAKAKAKAKANL